jgi:hypothetical protein
MSNSRKTRDVGAAPGWLGLAILAGAAALAATGCGSTDRATIDMPTSPSQSKGGSNRAAANTRTIEIFNGKRVWVDRFCATTHHVSSRKADLIAGARRLPPLKQTLLNERRKLRRFLAAHPGHTLAPTDFARYRSLVRRYRLALARYNRKVAAYNLLARRFNADLKACKKD